MCYIRNTWFEIIRLLGEENPDEEQLVNLITSYTTGILNVIHEPTRLNEGYVEEDEDEDDEVEEEVDEGNANGNSDDVNRQD